LPDVVLYRNCLFGRTLSDFLIPQVGEILIIDAVTTILNLMTAFGLLAVASLVRTFCLLKIAPSHSRADHVRFH